jgi:hypothetical protein
LGFFIERRTASAVLGTVCLALVPVIALIAKPGMATAGQGGVGVVNAVGAPSVPAGTPIAVVAEEFTDLNTELQDVIERALAGHGFTVDQDAPLILSFDVEMTNATADIEDRAGANIVGSGEPGATESPYEERPLQDAGGELGRYEPEIGGPQVTIPFGHGGGGGAKRSLSFVLGRDGRPPIWQGSVTATLPSSNPLEAAQAMVPVLVDYIGRTVRGEQVTID